MKPHLIIVGGGIAGLAAALEAIESGAEVTVIDAGAFGGKLRTSTFAGRLVDEGPDSLLARVPEAVDLANRVGLGEELTSPVTSSAFICLDNTLVPLPRDHVLGIPSDPDAPDLRAILGPDALDRLRRERDAPPPRPQQTTDQTIGAFVRSRLGDEVADRLVGPLVGGINAGDIDELSLAATTPQLDLLARSEAEPSVISAAHAMRSRAVESGPVFVAPRSGMASLVEATTTVLRARGATLHEHTSVRGLERTGSTWRVIADDEHRGGVATEVTFDADGVIIATPASIASTIVQDHAPTAGEHLGSIRYASVVIATFAFAPDAIGGALTGSGFLVPRTEQLLTTAASWSSSKWAHLAPEHGDGTVVIRASAGRSNDRRIAAFNDDDLIEKVADELTTIMQLGDAPTATRLTRWPSSLPQYDVGHLSRIDEIEADLAHRARGLAIAGAALRGVGIPASIRSGQVAARRLVESLDDVRSP